MTTRTTIYLDESSIERGRRFISPRGLSSLAGELLVERDRQLEQAVIEASMREGYLATRMEEVNRAIRQSLAV